MDTPRSDDALSLTSMQVVELKRKLEEERDGYRRKLQSYQEGQQRQAQLVQKLQSKVSHVRVCYHCYCVAFKLLTNLNQTLV